MTFYGVLSALRLLPIELAAMRREVLCVFAVMMIACLVGCQTHSQVGYTTSHLPPAIDNSATLLASTQPPDTDMDSHVQAASYTAVAEHPLPRVRDIGALTLRPMSLDEAIRIALENSPVIRGAGGQTLGTTFNPAIFATDPNLGPEAALAAYDTQLKSSLGHNNGSNALSSGSFGVFSQPTDMAELGVGRTFSNGSRVHLGSVGGYDTVLAGGVFGAYGGEMRFPLMRGAGTEFNRIAGPNARPGAYHGIWITQLDASKIDLELEQAVQDLVREVAMTYWALYFSYHDLEAKQAALEQARQTWLREQTRVAEQVSPPDAEATARQQYYSADAAVQNAISGTGPGGTGVYGAELKLRTLLALPAADGSLIQPTSLPLEAELHFDWNEALQLAHTRRVELRKQQVEIQKRELELRAARNLRRPQFDVVGRYRRPAADLGNRDTSFAGALQGWQVGVEYSRAWGNRREDAAVRNAELNLRRDRVLLEERYRQVSAQLRFAFTELERAYGVTQSLILSRDAAKIRLQAEQERHAAGEAHIDSVLEAQIRATQSETSMLRSLVDYNLAVINLQYVRGTLLETFGVGFVSDAAEGEMSIAKNDPSIYVETDKHWGGGPSEFIALPPPPNNFAPQPSHAIQR